MSENHELHGILLEAGTNELEVLVFQLGKLCCGVNVAKVREVLGAYKCTPVPRSHPAVVGVYNLRDEVIPLIDLQLYFYPGQPSQAEHRNVIVTEFNDLKLGFLVDDVDRIHRMRWEAILPLPESMASIDTAVTSVCQLDGGKIAMMIDFEKVAFDIQGVSVDAAEIEPAGVGVERHTRRLLLAEDSPTMRAYMEQTLVGAGYQQVTAVTNGVEAWAALEMTLIGAAPAFDVIISDIEMPQMDGLYLCRRIKEHHALRDIPVVVFSSLVSEDNLKKLAAVAADASLTKPELARLVGIIDGLLAGRAAAAEPV